MALKLSETSCVFRQIPLNRLARREQARRAIQAANDNAYRPETKRDSTDDDGPTLTDVGPILALLAIAGGTFYFISVLISGYLKSFPMIYP